MSDAIGRRFTADEVIEMANETSDSFGNLYRLDFIDRIRHEAVEGPPAQNPTSLPSSIDASPEPAPVDPAPLNGPQIANLGDGANGQLSEAEGNAWDALWDDADIICTCDGCNYYSPTYDPDRECSLAAHIKAISAAIVREHTERAWDEGAQAAWLTPWDGEPTNPYRAARQERDPR